MSEATMITELVSTINSFKIVGITLVSVWGVYKIIMEIINKITARHDKEKKWDEMAGKISAEREVFASRYDVRLTEMEKKIDENHADTEAKLQQIGADMYMHTMVLNAVLDGLTQLGANGNVTQAKHDLDAYITKQAYDVKQ